MDDSKEDCDNERKTRELVERALEKANTRIGTLNTARIKWKKNIANSNAQMELLSKTIADKDMNIKALERVRYARLSDLLEMTKQTEQICLEIEGFDFGLERLFLFVHC